jgi:CHAT domain-containing protein
MECQPSLGRNRRRLTWLPTGAFNFVPIHAAGIYAELGSSCCDFVVSSYTPSLGALLQAQQGSRTTIARAELKTLLIAEPHAPGLARLPHTLEELTALGKLIPPENMLQVVGMPHMGIDDDAELGTTVDQVVETLHQVAVVHLACHGYQDPQNPLKSGFFLRDGKLTIAKIMQQQLQSAFFAFLGACETAKGDRHQPDQSVHLAAAVMFAGFRSIVGTMW